MSRRRILSPVVPLLLMLASCNKPVGMIAMLDGCYEGEGLPDFMRPDVHWAFRLNDGAVVDRSGQIISKATLGRSHSETTDISFNPGIRISDNKHKELTVYRGNDDHGQAYLNKGRPTIRIGTDWTWEMQLTSCGPT